MVVQNNMMTDTSQGYTATSSRTDLYKQHEKLWMASSDMASKGLAHKGSEHTSNITSGERVLKETSNTSKQNTSSKTPQTAEQNIADSVVVSIEPKSKQRNVADFNLKRNITDLQENITSNQVEDMSLAELSKKLYKITQLSIEARDESNSYADRREIQDEINKLRLEIRGVDVTESATTIGKGEVTPEQPAAALSKNIAGTYEEAVEQAPNVAINYNEIFKKIENIDVTTMEGIENAIQQTTEAINYIEQARMYLSVENNKLQNIVTTSNNIDRHLAEQNLEATYIPSSEVAGEENVANSQNAVETNIENYATDTVNRARKNILEQANDSVNVMSYSNNAMVLSLLE